MASSKRELLVDTALELFKRHGYHATGIDRVIAEAGIARMTLYNHFKSKDELILAVLQKRDERFRDWMAVAVEQRTEDPKERLLAVFDALSDWFATEDFTGCMFINAAAEFAQAEDPIHRASREHKELGKDYLLELCKAAGARDPETLADGLCLLSEGAIVMAHVAGQKDAGQRAKSAARTLIRDAGL